MASGRIAEEGGIAIAFCIKKNNTLKNVDIGRNCLGYEGGIGIKKSLEINSSVVEIDLCDNNFTRENIAELVDLLGINFTLRKISLTAIQSDHQRYKILEEKYGQRLNIEGKF